MTRTLPDWAYLTDESGRHWYHLTKGTKLPVDGGDHERPPVRAVYAIPSKDLISHPHWVSSKEPEIISQVVAAETEKIGVKQGVGPGTITDWKPVQYNGTRTLVQSVAIPWEFKLPDSKATQFTDFIPQYSLYTPARNAVILWKESGEWVAGYSREDQWAHIQPLGKLTSSEIAAEVQLTLMELSAKGITSPISDAVVWGNYEISLHENLQNQAGLEVAFAAIPSPVPSIFHDWAFEPHEISAEKLRKAKQRKAIWTGILALLFVLCLAAAALFHLWTLEDSNVRLLTRIEENREAAERIREAKSKWEALSPAIEPQRSPIELFYQASMLLPEKGIRFTSFEIEGHNTITISGETSAAHSGINLNANLQKAEGLADFEWEEFNPRPKGDIQEFTAIGKYRSAE